MPNRRLFLALTALAIGCANAEEDGPAEPTVTVDSGADTTPAEDTAVDSSTPDTSVEETTPDAEPTEVCGNNKLEGEEECDDGNKTPGDGCDATCKFESTGPDDTCEGLTVALTGTGSEKRVAQVKDDTTKNRHNYASVCGGGSSKDAVYKFVPDVTGRVTAKIRAEYEAIFSVRNTCTDPKTEVLCADTLATGNAEILFGAKAGEPFYIFVDGYGGTSGPFTLDVAVDVASCGNGSAELPEECDDGNNTDGDGCSKDCKLEGEGSIEDCPGKAIKMTAPMQLSLAGDTSKLAHNQTGADGCTSTWSGGPDAVYAVTPKTAGTLRAKLTSEGAKATIYERTECAVTTAAFQLDCRNADAAKTPLTLTTPVRAEQTYYIVVDNGSTSGAPFTLDLSLTTSTCGNGMRDSDEQCDDGNTTAGDGCDATCKVESMAANDVCPTDLSTVGAITLTSSTDGSLVGSRTGSTAGLTNKVKLCNTTATATLGDAVYRVRPTIAGMLTATMTTDSFKAAISAQTSCAATTNLGCGKSTVGLSPATIKLPVEKDTDYLLVAEGSSATDMGAFRVDVTVSPSVCGNGVIEGGETCDDGNTIAGDGCTAACALEPVTGDACSDAQVITLNTEGTLYTKSLRGGTTNLKHDNTFSSCTSAGRDAYYQFVAPIDGVLTVRAAATYNLSLGIRGGTTCATSGAQLACVNATSTGTEEVTIGVSAGQTYWIIVDTTTIAAGAGPFDLDVILRPAGCGDTTISGGETCDDGNMTSGDGCSSTCAVETIAGIDTCPGAPLTLAGTIGTRRAVVTVDTSKLNADYAGSCGGASKDAVLAINPPVSGTLVVQQKNGSGFIIHARTSCSDATTEMACKTGLLELPVTAGTPVYLFVDAPPGKEGTVTLDVSVTP